MSGALLVVIGLGVPAETRTHKPIADLQGAPDRRLELELELLCLDRPRTENLRLASFGSCSGAYSRLAPSASVFAVARSLEPCK